MLEQLSYLKITSLVLGKQMILNGSHLVGAEHVYRVESYTIPICYNHDAEVMFLTSS
jgi:hypothetical protein